MKLDDDRFSTYHGKVHTPKLSGKPKCVFNGDKLVDSVSAGRIIWEIIDESSTKDDNSKTLVKRKK